MKDDIIRLKKELIYHQSSLHDLAFVIGNGVNRYAQGNNDWSWKKILCEAWGNITRHEISSTKGMNLTEMYNLLEFQTDKDSSNLIKEEIIKPFKSGTQTIIHRQLQTYLENWNVPVLTTNFDHLLEDGYIRFTLRHPLTKDRYNAKSSYYPWDRYFSNKEIYNPARDYAVWHINGFVDFLRSIKLSFSEYIAQASHTRPYLHIDGGKDDFGNKNISNWIGFNTWLHPMFNCSLCIIGLALDEDETFLRWLLIERKKYFRRFHDREHRGWYIYQKDESFPEGKRLFMEGVGLIPVAVNTYADVYEYLLNR